MTCLIVKIYLIKCYQKVWRVEMMGLIGAGNNPMVGMTVACAVAASEANK
jgi:hypothetical protein